MKIGETMGVLDSFAWNYVKYANMKGFRRDSHNNYVTGPKKTGLIYTKYTCLCYGTYILFLYVLSKIR